jgi:2-polyprenyl-3-methyl-5-hydroxy-6-metoxy-1,4-benzoquinol methylase
MLDLENDPCPVCGNANRSAVFHVATYPEHHYRGPFTLRKCECGLLFNSPRLDLEALGQLYGKNYYFFLRNDAREFARIVAMYQRTIGMLSAEIAPKKTLDIGCGRGYFPAVLKGLGWDAHGVEISPDAADYARKTFSLDVFTGTIEQYAANASARQFPLVTAIDVIEHVPSPQAFLEAAVKAVAPGGRLIIDTPNAAAGNIALKGKHWKGFNPFHIYLFTAEHLATMLQRLGMTLEQRFSYGNAATPLNLRDRAIGALRATHTIAPVVSAYFAFKKPTLGAPADPMPLVSAAVERIRAEPPYRNTPDASDTFAGEDKGDNIVVIARKPE